jgi:triacylglycerol esterase/lipase EstA (alpha/beta hydrolase family)
MFTPFSANAFASIGAWSPRTPGIFGSFPIASPFIAESRPDPYVVLVHGYHRPTADTTCGMDALESYLGEAGNTGGREFRVLCLDYSITAGVEYSAHQLGLLLDDLLKQTDQVDLVVHSMGGLVARWYIEQLGQQQSVRSVTMVGTPNLGTVYGWPPCIWKSTDVAACGVGVLFITNACAISRCDRDDDIESAPGVAE